MTDIQAADALHMAGEIDAAADAYRRVIAADRSNFAAWYGLGGVRLREGEKILLFLGAANRDPRRWENPGRFDIKRRASGHVAFGYGIHSCVGQMVARPEGEIVLGALARRVERLELSGEPLRRMNNTLRGLASLPLRVS